MEKDTKIAIDTVVKRYIQLYPEEYNAVVDQIWVSRNNQFNKLATTTEDGIIQQKLFEIPEKLHTMIKKNLTQKQWDDYTSEHNPEASKRNARWFARTYKQFAIAQEI
jgi:hypothetical protein